MVKFLIILNSVFTYFWSPTPLLLWHGMCVL